MSVLLFLSVIENPRERLKMQRLYEKYNKLVYFYVNEILNNHHLSEEAVQDTYLRILNNLSKINEREETKTVNFIITVAKNVARSKAVKENKVMPVDFDDAENDYLTKDSFDLEDYILGQDSYDEILSQVNKLDEITLEILRLKYINDFSDRMVAQICNLTEANVRVRLHRARQKIKSQLLAKGGQSNEQAKSE